jgi:hypothetical protein
MILSPDGYDQAVRREIERRDRAWLAVPLPLGKGVRLKPYTLRLHVALAATGNRLAAGKGTPELGDVLAFLWYCSTAYTPPGKPLWKLRRWLFWRRCIRLKIDPTLDALREYLADAWGDCPIPLRKPALRKAPKTSALAQYVHRLAPMGWSMDDVLDRPMGIVWQVMRACDLADDPSMLYDDESERVKFAYVARRNEAAKADSGAPTKATA